jgi:hypothetical protein
MSLGEILDRAIQMMKANLALFAGIAALPALMQMGSSLARDFMQTGGTGDGVKAVAMIANVLFLIANLILAAMAWAARCWATSQLIFDRPVTVGGAYAMFGERKGRLVGLSIVQGLMSFWPVIPVAIVIAIVMEALAPGLRGLGVVAIGVMAFAVCLPLYARYLLAFPATAILDTDVHNSLRRSAELGRGFRWKVLWSYALPVGIGLALDAGGVGLIGWVQEMHPWSTQWLLFWSAMEDFWIFLMTLVFGPLGSIALTLTYYDLCVRKEGLDVAVLMEQAGMGMPAGLAGETAAAIEEQQA